MINLWTTENLDPSNLLFIWKDITHALITSGRGADLYQELCSALTAHHEELTIYNASGATMQHQQESSPPISLLDKPQKPANSTENGRLSEFDDEEPDSLMSSLDETDVDDDLSFDLGVTSHIIDEGADLSHWHTRLPSATFEEIFADEETLPAWDVQSAKDETYLGVELISRPCTSSSHASKPFIASKEVVKHYPKLQADRPDGPYHKDVPIPPLPMSATRTTRRRTMVGGLRVSDKRDLTPAQVEVVAGLLICKDSILYFLDNCRLIYELWTSSRPLANNADADLITALDLVQSLLKGNRIQRLLLRFAYMHLAKAIDNYKAVAATDRIRGNADRPVGIRDATIAIDRYLKAKETVSGEDLKRSTVLSYSRAGRRWADLVGPSPLLVFVLPQKAETIVQNNSITDMTVRTIADQIQSHNPELTKALINISQYSGIDPSSMKYGLASMQDIVVRTTQEVDPICRRMP